jgi:multiple sugar transport system permease protein
VRLWRRLTPLAFLAPFAAGTLAFVFYPIVDVVRLSFLEGHVFLTGESSGVGFGNYAAAFADPHFATAVRNTTLYAAGVIPTTLVLGLASAWLLNRSFVGRRFFQTVYFLPLVTSATAIGLAWRWIFNFDYGVLNYFLSLIGLPAVNWLNDPSWGLVALMVYGVWSMLPLTTVLLLVGMQNIDPRYGLAARVDGAGAFARFRTVTMPLLAPSIGLVLIVNLITSARVFDELFPLFNGKPGVAGSLYTMVYFIYDAFFKSGDLGKASAAAIVFSIAVLALALAQLRLQRRWRR